MPPPPPTHILETALDVLDLNTSVSFYKDILNLTPFLHTPRMAAFALSNTTLLVFQLGLIASDSHPTAKDTIPGHGPSEDVLNLLQTAGGKSELKQHYCLAVSSKAEVQEWEQHFEKEGVKVLGTMDWERGGRSVYFADPDGHVGEIASRGIWAHY
jgi:catechol 2,3-dioxygenase-like lactoylglutathione lyase family enzyme